MHGPDGWVDRRPTEAGGNEPPTRLSRLIGCGSFSRLLLNAVRHPAHSRPTTLCAYVARYVVQQTDRDRE